MTRISKKLSKRAGRLPGELIGVKEGQDNQWEVLYRDMSAKGIWKV
ncbi:hypothetical protein ACFL96_06165 [Thermoproteota archaeon]